MPNSTKLAKVVGVIAFLTISLAASGAGKSCWLSDAAAPNPSAIYLLCEQGTVLVSADGGAKFNQVDTKVNARHLAMAFSDVNHGLIVGEAGMILGTEDGAKTWVRRDSGTKEHLRAIYTMGNSTWVVGFSGLILHSVDGGRTWAKQKSGTSQTIEGVYFVDADHGWAVGWAGTILRTLDGGNKWLEVKSAAATWSLSNIYFRDTQNGWAMGFSGQLLRSKDGGATWTALTACDDETAPGMKPSDCSPVKSWLTSVAFDRGNKAWIAADDQFLVSDDGGEKWKAVDYEGQLYMRKFVAVGDSLWAVGQLGVLRQVGGAWKPVESVVVGSSAVMDMATPAATKKNGSE